MKLSCDNKTCSDLPKAETQSVVYAINKDRGRFTLPSSIIEPAIEGP